MRADWFIFSKQMSVAAEQRKKSADFCFGRFPKLNLVVSLLSREKIKCINFIKFCIHAVNPPHSLHHASRVPWEIVVYDRVRSVQVYAFRQYFGADKGAIIIFWKSGFSVKVFNNLLPNRRAGTAGKAKRLVWKLFVNFFGEIFRF